MGYNVRMKIAYLFICALCSFVSSGAIAEVVSGSRDSVIGYWTTIDDATGEKKSLVRVYEHQGKVYARVIEVLTKPDAKAKIKGEPPIKGLDIVKDLKKDGDKYTGGKVLDPKNGKVYTAKIWLEGGNLIMRGSLFGIGRKQRWIPAEAPAGASAEIMPDPKF